MSTRPALQIGSHSLPNQIILAPMAGVTDLPYRNICREHGAGAAVAEMLISDQGLWNTPTSSFRQVQSSESGLRWIQILGNDPQEMAQAAQACEQQGAHIVDINMGCPAKKVCRKAAGSALLQDEPLVGKILDAVVKAVSIPVTLKIRTGWNANNKNALNIARMAEQSGIAALSIHGRTRACKYEAAAEFDTAAKVKQCITIPLIVNGDIATPQQAKHVLALTGANGVMIGRAALGNPWLFHQMDRYINHGEQVEPPSFDELMHCMTRHVRGLHAFYGSFLSVRIARKHVGWYEEQFPQMISLRHAFNRLTTVEEQLALLDHHSWCY
jgi:tRNA-dihydrouridine synthase B